MLTCMAAMLCVTADREPIKQGEPQHPTKRKLKALKLIGTKNAKKVCGGGGGGLHKVGEIWEKG